MQLNKFTDYALRILMYVSQPKALPHTIAELAQALQVSENHLMKIVHFMAKQQWDSTQSRNPTFKTGRDCAGLTSRSEHCGM